ncbi:hypothetical protein J5N97_005452 [Dioscorea zingiberensis]|uniref:Bromo domain-containing protein n=1 Tax=Dioscorea zingiberensis TaxID=325984 RepID=A0A9D5D855_9LILI|nr:hypothetical protein J5N97_005452 [Dioscorea zingiberensis]
MARSEDPEEGEGEIWGTWEELLLASAASRHGTNRWDSVAMEVQSRIPPSSAHLFTSLRCRQRFHLLQHRFSTTAAATAEGEPDVGSYFDVPRLEELRSSVVAEVRHEVDRSDLSISGLAAAAAFAEEPETDVVSPHAGSVPGVGSQPLFSFLHIVRSSKPGSVFARRLESQETAKYKGLIRRHVDLEMVGWRIERSGGAYTRAEFFRDLLLLCNNAIVFYPKASGEAIAAVHLRELISKEMAASKERPAQAQPPPVTPAPQPQPQPQLPKPKEDPDLAGSLLEKSTSAAPLMIVCRKRSSISAKKVDPDRKEEKEEKSDPDRKERDAEDPTLKKKTKERSSFPPTRGLRTNKTRSLPKNSNPDPSRISTHVVIPRRR